MSYFWVSLLGKASALNSGCFAMIGIIFNVTEMNFEQIYKNIKNSNIMCKI